MVNNYEWLSSKACELLWLLCPFHAWRHQLVPSIGMTSVCLFTVNCEERIYKRSLGVIIVWDIYFTTYCFIFWGSKPTLNCLYRYVALNMLMKAITVDAQAVQRHRATILECVKVSDHVIIFALIPPSFLAGRLEYAISWLVIT